jgi:hypothetical protein
MGGIPQERRKRGRPRKMWMEGVSTSNHDNKKFGTRSVGKQGGMAFGIRKKATAVIKPDGWMDRQMDTQMDRWMDGWMDRQMDGWMDWWMDG